MKRKSPVINMKLLIFLPLLGAMAMYFADMAKAQVLNVNTSGEKGFEQQTVEVPFAVVEEVPVFPGCENLPQNEQKACMTDKINSFINRNYDLDLPEKLGLHGPTQVMVRFKINPSGKIVDVEAAGPYPELSAEGEKVIKKLPGMLPGKQRGKPVTVLYSVPISLNVPN